VRANGSPVLSPSVQTTSASVKPPLDGSFSVIVYVRSHVRERLHLTVVQRERGRRDRRREAEAGRAGGTGRLQDADRARRRRRGRRPDLAANLIAGTLFRAGGPVNVEIEKGCGEVRNQSGGHRDARIQR